MSYDHLIKIVLAGDSSTGKSCLLTRFADGYFNQPYLSTIGVDFKLRTVTYDSSTIKLQIWDTAGQERFKVITSSYYRGANAIFIVFDLNNRESFANISKWYHEIRPFTFDNTVMMLVGCKSDLKWTVTIDEIKAVAEELGMNWYVCSASENRGVESLFQSAIRETMDRKLHRHQYQMKELSIQEPYQADTGCCIIL